MDENTKHIVAGILTAGYCANRPGNATAGDFHALVEGSAVFPLSEKAIVEVYRHFLAHLEGTAPDNPDSVEEK